MKKILLFLLILVSPIYADGVSNAPLEVTEEDASPSTFPYKLKFANGNVTDNGDGTVSVASGSGHDAVTLGTDADVLLGLSTQQITLDSQTANYVFAGPGSGAAADPTFRALVDNDVPDTITLTNLTQITTRSHTALSDIGTNTHAQVDTHIAATGTAAHGDSYLLNSGDVGTGVYDFGGATSMEIPNTAGDVTCDAGGEAAIDSTEKEFAYYDGTQEVAISSYGKITVLITSGDWDLDSDKWVQEFDTTKYPNGIVITKWTVDANVADPAVELNANLMYCDALSNGAFPGANATLIDVLDTTTGNSTETNMANSDLGSGIIPAGKIAYVDIDIDPATDADFYVLQVYFYRPES